MNSPLLETNRTLGPPLHPWIVGVLWLTTSLVSLGTILGNLLVLLAFATERTLRVTSNFLIVSLAISDLIIGLEGFPVLTHFVSRRQVWPFGPSACKIWIAIDYTLCLVSILTVLLITVDRYLSVCFTAPYRKWQSERKALIAIGISWSGPLALFLGMLCGFYQDAHSFYHGKCYAPFLDDPYLNMSMYIAYYWLTLLAMVVLYRGIHRVASEVQERAEAKEKQAIAMAALQRCMAQMGVSMLLATSNVNICKPAASQAIRDSGYSTTTAQVSPSAPIVSESQLVPDSFASESDSAVHETPSDEPREPCFIDAEPETPGPEATTVKPCEFTARKTEPKPGLTPEIPSPSSSYTSYASQIDSEGMAGSLRDILLFGNEFFPSSIAYFPFVDDNFNPDSGNAPSQSPIRSFTSQPPSPKLPIKYCSSWPKKGKPKLSDRSSLNIQKPVCQTISEESPNTSPVITTVVPVVNITIELQPDPSSTPQSPHPLTHKGGSIHDLDIPRKDNVLVSTLRRFSNKETKSDERRKTITSSPSTSSVKSSSSKSKARASVRSAGEANDLAAALVAKASKAFSGGQEYISSLFSNSWLLGRRRQKTRAERRARKAFRTITIILGAFVLFWSPYYILATVYGFCRGCVPQWLYVMSYYMCYLNSSVNPFCYALANRQFKIAFKRILRGELTKKRGRPSNNLPTGL